MKKQASPANTFDGHSRPPGVRRFFNRSPRSSVLVVLGAAAAIFVVLTGATQAQTVVDWTFETSAPAGTTTGPGATSSSYSPEVNFSGAAASAYCVPGGTGASTTTTFSSPTGNGSAKSFGANNFATGGYFQFTLSTAGTTGPVGVSYDQYGSNTGPRDFALQYSTDGTTFTTLTGSAYQIVIGTTISASTYNPAYTHTFDLSSISALSNNATVAFRVVVTDSIAINGTTTAAAGSDRIDNFSVVVPEPTTVLGAVMLTGVAAWSLRRRLLGSMFAQMPAQ